MFGYRSDLTDEMRRLEKELVRDLKDFIRNSKPQKQDPNRGDHEIRTIGWLWGYSDKASLKRIR